MLLPDQDRGRWDHAQIREGVTLAGAGLRRSPDLHRRLTDLDTDLKG